MRKFVVIMILVAYCATLMAQSKINRMLVGQISVEKTSQPVPYANIVLFNSLDTSFLAGTTSDAQGNFVLNLKENESIFVRISSIGYETKYVSIVPQSDTNFCNVFLQPIDVQQLAEVKIRADKPLYVVDGEKEIYNVSEDANIQNLTLEDALQSTPGIEVDAKGDITFRGTQSVEIWLNGKPANFSDESQKQYIKTLPANSVDAIEVISNPSAQYNSSTCIVNIVSNKKVVRNDFFAVGADASTSPIVIPWLSYLFQNEKFMINVFGGYVYGEQGVENSGNSEIYEGKNLSRSQNYDGSGDEKRNSGYLGLNLDYNFDEKNSLSVWGMGMLVEETGLMNFQYSRTEHIYKQGFYEFLQSKEREDDMLMGQGGFWYTHRFNDEGHELAFSGNGSIDKSSSEYNWERIYSQPWSAIETINYAETAKQYTTELDLQYTIPYSKGTVMLGTSAAFNDKNLNILWNTEQGSLSLSPMLDTLSTKDLYTNDNVYSVYATVQHRIKKFSIKLGVRAQYNDVSISYTHFPKYDFDTSHFDFVPSVHLTYVTPHQHNLKLNYTRRYSMPNSTQLTTFKTYDIDDFSVGNRNLATSYTHNFEAGWSKYIEKFGQLSLTAYLCKSDNAIGAINDVVFDDVFATIVPYTIYQNVGNSSTTGVEANVNYMPNPKLSARLYANLYNYYYKTQFRVGEWAEDEMLSYSLRLNFSMKVYKSVSVYVTGTYSSPVQGFLKTTDAVKKINFGANADFWNRRMSAYIAVDDVFDWTKDVTNITNPYYAATLSSKYFSRFLIVGFTFRFGKMELEQMAQQGNDFSKGM